ncbi:hypothetical protein SMA679_1403 [Streptococcus macedonicus]|nr:hypothetical protein SMA679_1403 [Streptococcus macedonicus]
MEQLYHTTQLIGIKDKNIHDKRMKKILFSKNSFIIQGESPPL